MTGFLYILLLLSCYHYGSAEEKTTCDDIISLQCPSQQIAIIINVNTSSDIASTFLEQCNTHDQCNVSNPTNECVSVQYWCKKNEEYIEIEPSSSIHLNTTKLPPFLVSKGYRKGEYQKAYDVDCNVALSDVDNKSKEMKIRIYELSPFANSADYCLSAKDFDLNQSCTGSGTLYTQYGTIPGNNSWQFSLKLSKTAKNVPVVRFWIDIRVLPQGDFFYNLQCNSQEIEENNVRIPYTFFIVVASIVGVIVCAGLTAMMIVKRRRFSKVLSVGYNQADPEHFFPPPPSPLPENTDWRTRTNTYDSQMRTTVLIEEDYFLSHSKSIDLRGSVIHDDMGHHSYTTEEEFVEYQDQEE